jgi:hypothetical protein
MLHASLLIVAGCVPFAAPPITAAVGVNRGTAMHAVAGFHADVGLSPAQLSPSLQHRSWDLTLSGSYDRRDRNVDTWGLAFAGGAVLHPWGEDDTAADASRLLPQLVGRWTTLGHGLGIRVVIEHSQFTSGEFDRRNAQGVKHGELAIGCYVEAGRQLGEVAEWSATIGLVLRMPALAGIGALDP